jgi:AraC family ethanolamine operon transcriptional activator
LVSALDVSRRTLQYAFQEALGINPASYLRVERLNRVRRALGNAQSVTEAATRFGFWHFGHFATEYRTLFGELPSETFRRHKGVVAPEQILASATPLPLMGWG